VVLVSFSIRFVLPTGLRYVRVGDFGSARVLIDGVVARPSGQIGVDGRWTKVVRGG
jgi:hypothetical protein